MNSFDVCRIYYSIKAHFNSKSYNAIDNNFNTKVIPQIIFQKSKQIASVCKYISEKYTNEEDVKDLMISNFVYDKNIDIFKIYKEEESKQRYQNYKRIKDSISHTFKKDLVLLFNSVNDINTIYKCTSEYGAFGHWPEIAIQAREGQITLETLIIMDDIMNLFDRWSPKLDNDWILFRSILDKYRSFVNYDKETIISIMKELVKLYK